MYRRFDIGWRDPGGNHGLIAAHDGKLEPGEEAPLLQWTDLTRAQFRTHWFFVSLTQSTMALIRVSPIDGGLRGAASYSHVLLVPKNEIAWGADLGALLEAIPAVPSQIGEPSKWAPKVAEVPALHADALAQLTASPALMTALLALPFPLRECQGVPADGLSQEEQITLALRCFALTPRAVRETDLYFASSEAPGYARPLFGFDTAISANRDNVTLAQFWLSVQGHVPASVLEAIDYRSPESVFGKVAMWITAESGLDATTVAQQLVGRLVAVPMGELEDAKFNAVEQALTQLAPQTKGPVLLALVQNLEATCVEGANPLWILRLLTDPAALATLPAGDRRGVLRRLFVALPNELARVLTQLPLQMHAELVRALHQALLSAGSIVGAQHPAALLALAERVLETGLMVRPDAGGVHDRRSAVLSLNLVFDLKRAHGADSSPLGQLATGLAQRVIVDPSAFAARLFDLAADVVAQTNTRHGRRGELLRFLLETSFHGVKGSPLAAFVRALATASRPGFGNHGATTILDAIQTVLPEDDQLWIPLMRGAVLSSAGGRKHVR